MAQDYHIYIHDSNGASGNGAGNKTTPFSAKSSDDESFSMKAASSQAFSTAKGIVNGSGASMGVAALTKVAPWIAVAVAAVKITDHVLSVGFSHEEEYTGNYVRNVNYNNYKALLSSFFNPVKTAMNMLHKQFQITKQNKEIAQQNRLIGNSILKDFNIGV